MATVNDILKKNKQINGTAAATPAVASADYTKYLANGSGTVGAMSTGAAATPTSASGSSSEEPGPLKKFWNDAVDAVNTGLDYLGNVGSAIGEGTTNVWNAVIGKPESAAPAAETETESAPISYTANMGNTGMMTSSEYLADKEQSNDWYYDDKKDYLGKTKEDALRAAEQAKTDAKIEAEALFRQNASNYGLRGEQMLEQGLAGGGYSEFLEGKNMETRARNYAVADANALAAAQVAQQNYNAAMDELNTWKKNADDELRTEKLELSEQVRAERDAKWNELFGYVQQGVYSVDEAATIWGAYANIYGNLTEAELQALTKAWANHERSKLDEYYDAFMNEYDTKGTKENYISYLVGKGFSEGVATDMANAKFAAAEEQQNQLIGSSLAALGDAVRGGTSASDAAELFKLQNPGKELTAEQMQSLQALENSYKTEAEGVIVEGLVEKALMLVQTLNEDATKEKVLQYIKNVDGYDPKYDERINAFVNTLFNPDGSLNVNNRTERAAKLEQLYASGVSAEEAEMILTAWGYEGLNGAEMERFESAYSVKNIQAVQSYIASLAASGTFTQKGLETYLDGLVSAGQLTDTAADNILNSYFDENGNRKTVSTTGELKQERNAIITTMVDAIRAGTYTAANGAVIVASQLGLEEGETLSVLEINALNAAYEEYKNQAKKDAVDKYMATVTALGGTVDKGLLFVYAVKNLDMEPSLALEMVSQTYDANGKFIYNPTVGFAEGKENISLKNYTNEELLELLNKVGIDVGEGEITVPDSGGHVGEIGLSWDDYLKAIETVCNENGITLTDEMKNAAKSWRAEDGKYYVTEGLRGQLKAIADGKENGGQPQPETKPETKPEEEPEKDGGFGDTITEGFKNFADSAKNFFGGAWDYSSKTVVDAYKKFKEWLELPENEGKTVEDYGKEMTAGSGAELISKIQSKDFNPSDKNYVSALLSSLENLKNNNLIGATAYETVVGMFNGGTAISTAAEFDNNTWRKTMEPGDNFTVKIDKTVYKVQSAGKADDTVKNAASGVDSRKVFAYKGELYIKDDAGNVYKIEGRDLNQDGYNELWNSIFGARITQACNVIIDEEGQEVFTGPMSISTARQNANNGGGDDSAFVESNAEILKNLQRGYAQVRTGKFGSWYVQVSGGDYEVKKGDAVLSNESLGPEIAAAASLVGNREAFIYNGKLYARDGDNVYKLESMSGLAGESNFKKITEAISANATDRLNYSDALLDTGSVVKFDGASVSRIDKIEGGIGDVNVTLAYGDKKYKLEVHAVLGASSEAVKAADKAGVEDGQIFAHHEDLYIYKVDDNGKKQAYRLGATDFFNNKDYDKFKEAVTGKKIGDDNIFGNYTKNLTGEGSSGEGGSPKPGEGGSAGLGGSGGSDSEGNLSSQIDFNNITGDDLKNYVNNNIKNAASYNKKLYSEADMKDVARGLGVEEKNLGTFLGKLTKEDGQYVWYESTKADQLSNYANLEYMDTLTTSPKMENGTLKISIYDKAGNLGTLDLKLTAVKENDPLANATYNRSGFFQYGEKWYYGFNNDADDSFKIYEVDPKSKDYGIIGKTKDEIAFKEVQRGNARFESDAFGLNKSLGNNDNIRAVINGKTYHVQSGGEVEGDELDELEAAVKDEKIEEEEIFKYGDKIYMKKGGKYYIIEQRTLSFWNDDDKLAEAISGNAKWDAENDELEDNLDHVAGSDASNIIKKTSFVYDDWEDAERGDTIKIELGDGKVYKLKARANLYPESSAAFKAAEAAGVALGEIFQHGRDLYLRRNGGLLLLSAVGGKKHNGDYEEVKKIISTESTELPYADGYLTGLQDDGKKLSFYTKDGVLTTYGYETVKNLNSTNNAGLKAAFDKANDKTVFTYGDKAYYKDGENAKRLKDIAAEEFKEYYSVKPTFKDKTIEGSGMSVSEFLQKREGFINITIGGKKLGNDEPANLEYKVGGKIAVLKEVAGNETKNVDIGIITDVFDENSGVFAKEQLKNIKSNEFFVVTDADGSKRIFIKSNDENGKIIVAELKITDATVKKNIFNAIDDKKVNENATSYTYNLTGNEVASKTGGGREFNYSDFT